MKLLSKVSSIVLSILLIVTSFSSVIVFASTVQSVGGLTVGNGATYDVDIGVNSASEIVLDNTNSAIYLAKSTGPENQTSCWFISNSGQPGVLKLPLPTMSPGRTLDKYILRFAGSGDAGWWNVKRVPGTSIDGLKNTDITGNATANDSAVKTEHNFGQVTSTSKVDKVEMKVYVVDITSYAKECYNAGQTYFYVGVYSNYTKELCGFSIINGLAEQYQKDTKPYVYYTEKQADEFAFISMTEPASKDDPFKITFNNPVLSSSVSSSNFTVRDISGENVVISEDDVIVSGSVISLDVDWEDYGYYDVTFKGNVSDTYQQSINISQSISFEISGGVGSSTALTSNPLVRLCSGKGSTCGNKGHIGGSYEVPSITGKTLLQNHYVLFQFDLSQIDPSKQVSNAVFKFTCDDDLNLQAAVVPDYTWDATAGSDASYFSEFETAFANSENKIVTTPAYTAWNVYGYTSDVTKTISDAMIKGSGKVTFAVYTGSTQSVFGTSYSNAGYRPALTLNLVDKSFNAIETSPAKGGVMDGVAGNVELTLGTTISDVYANDNYIQLQDMNGNKVEATVDVSGSKVTIDPASDLAETTEYFVVLKVGTEDAFYNVLEADKYICRFTTGLAIEFDEIYFTSDASPEYGTSAKITGYNAGDSVTAVAQVTNNTSADYSAIMIIALYSSDGALLKVDSVGNPAAAPAGTTTQFAKTISVDEDAEGTAIKAFVWRDLVTLRPISKLSSIEQN